MNRTKPSRAGLIPSPRMIPPAKKYSPFSLKDILGVVGALETSGPLETNFTDVQCRLNLLQPGDLFAAVVDHYRNDHVNIPAAIHAGAKAILLSTVPTAPIGVPWIRTDDVGKRLGALCAYRYAFPSQILEVVGVTGTNGKTTTTYLLESMIAAAGHLAGRIGTVGIAFAGNMLESQVLTTPEAPVLHRTLADMAQSGVNIVAMEVSSQAIAMDRVKSCRIPIRVLTGVGHDHLDYHGDMESYAATKVDWILEGLNDTTGGGVVCPIDDPYAHAIISKQDNRIFTFGFRPEGTIHPTSLVLGEHGSHGSLSTPFGSLPFETSLLGKHNVRNVMAAVGAALHLNIPLAAISAGLAGCKTVPGRLQEVPHHHGFRVLIDFAHTPDALEAMLRSVRELTNGKVIAVFGCHSPYRLLNNRRDTKRKMMAKIGYECADISVLTSDNPRYEVPLDILSEMEEGLPRIQPANVIIEPERRKAIYQALVLASPGDVVIICGKGHEKYQIIGERQFPFDDAQVAAELLAGRLV